MLGGTSVLLLVLASACVDDLDPPSLVKDVRALGARVTVQGQPSDVAWPAPGETVDVTWATSAPGSRIGQGPDVEWSFELCPGRNAREVFCGGDPYAEPFVGSGPVASMTFPIPDAATLGETRYLILTGIICEAGFLQIDSDGVRSCGDRADDDDTEPQGTTAALNIPVRLDADPLRTNRHPQLSADALTFGPTQLPWPEITTLTDICSDPAVPRVAVDSEDFQLATVRTRAEDREPYIAKEGTTAEPVEVERLEGLQLGLFVQSTLPPNGALLPHVGELEATFAFVDDETPSPELVIEWEAPTQEQIDKAGVSPPYPVDFIVTIRDQRGGFHSMARTFCVVQP